MTRNLNMTCLDEMGRVSQEVKFSESIKIESNTKELDILTSRLKRKLKNIKITRPKFTLVLEDFEVHFCPSRKSKKFISQGECITDMIVPLTGKFGSVCPSLVFSIVDTGKDFELVLIGTDGEMSHFGGEYFYTYGEIAKMNEYFKTDKNVWMYFFALNDLFSKQPASENYNRKTNSWSVRPHFRTVNNKIVSVRAHMRNMNINYYVRPQGILVR